MKKIAIILFSSLLLLSACNSNHSHNKVKKENITINSKSKSYVIKEKLSKKPKEIKVYKIKKDGKQDITNNGVIKKQNKKIEWIGTPNKYKDIKSLLGDTIHYKIIFKNNSSKEKDLNIKYN